MSKLIDHLRQYKHNDNSGLVAGYDKLGVDALVNRLEEEVKSLKAQIELYRRELVNNSETFTMLDDWTHPNVECDAPASAIDELLEKTRQHCLADVKAEAVEHAHSLIAGSDNGELCCDIVEEYAQQLRDNAK